MAVTVDRTTQLWKDIYAKNAGTPDAEKLTDALYRYKVLDNKLNQEKRRIKWCEPKKNVKY